MFDGRRTLSDQNHPPITLYSDTSGTLGKLLTHTHPTNVGQMPVLRRLRDLRIRRGMTQIELAERANVTRTTVIRLEAGDPNGRPTTYRKLARALSTRQHTVTIDEMIGD